MYYIIYCNLTDYTQEIAAGPFATWEGANALFLDVLWHKIKKSKIEPCDITPEEIDVDAQSVYEEVLSLGERYAGQTLSAVSCYRFRGGTVRYIAGSFYISNTKLNSITEELWSIVKLRNRQPVCCEL